MAIHEIDLRNGAVLETGCVYLVPLMERLELSFRISGLANPKSSTGRLDVFTRLITDHAQAFDRVDENYHGPLYAEISPRTFPILVRKGSRLNQLRLRHGSPQFTDTQLKRLHEEVGLVDGPADIEGGLALSADLQGDSLTGQVGWRARRHAGVIDVDKRAAYDPLDFWDPVYARKSAGIVLDPDEFYILASREAVSMPPDFAAEMMPFNPMVGEFRVHYAGFFDPGFGHETGQGRGARAVLEVRSREVPVCARTRPDHRPARLRTVNGYAAASLWAGLRFELPTTGAEAVETLPRALDAPCALGRRHVLKLCHFVNTALQNWGCDRNFVATGSRSFIVTKACLSGARARSPELAGGRR